MEKGGQEEKGNDSVRRKPPGSGENSWRSGGSLPLVLFSHRIVASPRESSMKVVGWKSCVQSHCVCDFPRAFLGQLRVSRAW